MKQIITIFSMGGVDRTRKIPVTTLLRAIGIEDDDQILALFGDETLLKATMEKDPIKSANEALIEIYKKLRQHM